MADAPTTYRLRDLSVHEVSGVDRPANKRAFLIIKSEDSMAKELVDRGDGIMVEKTDGTSDVGTIDATIKEGLTLTADAKKAIGASLTNAAKRLNALAAAVAAAPEGEVSDVPPALAREIEVVARHLDSMVPENAMKNADVSKAGRKISAARHAMLLEMQQTISAMSTKMTELLADLGDEAVTTPPEGGGSTTAAAKAAAVAPPPAEGPLHKAMVELATIVKQQGQMLAQLAGTGGGQASNAQQPGERVAKSATPFQWPENLNETIPDDERFE